MFFALADIFLAATFEGNAIPVYDPLTYSQIAASDHYSIFPFLH